MSKPRSKLVLAAVAIAAAVAGVPAGASVPQARFTTPYDIAPLPKGDLLIADGESGKVLRYTARTRHLSVYVRLPNRELTGMARLPDGTLFVSDIQGGTIWKIDTRKRATRFARVPAPTEIVLRGRTLYVGSLEDDKVYAVDSRTAARTLVAAVTGPHGLALGPDGALYVSSPPSSLKRIDLSTGEISTVLSGEGYEPVFGPDGTLYVLSGSPAGSKLSRVGAGGSLTRVVGTGRIGPDRNGVAATTVGLLITDAVFAPSGRLLVAQAAPRPARIRSVDLETGRITTVLKSP